MKWNWSKWRRRRVRALPTINQFIRGNIKSRHSVFRFYRFFLMTNCFVAAKRPRPEYIYICLCVVGQRFEIPNWMVNKTENNTMQFTFARRSFVAAHNWMMSWPWVTIEPNIYSSITIITVHITQCRNNNNNSNHRRPFIYYHYYSGTRTICPLQLHQRRTLCFCANNKRAHTSAIIGECVAIAGLLLSFASIEIH